MIVQELIAKLGFDIDESGANKVSDSLASIVKGAALAAGAMWAVHKAFEGLAFAVKEAADLEGMNAQFEVMLGNAEAAKYLTQQIQQFAAQTPFETKPLVENVRLMMSFGQSANESLKAVKMLGDVAGADQNKLNSLSLAYAQIFASGKLQGQDLLQLVNAGFNPLKILAEKSGKSMGTLREEMSKGKISADMVRQAFEIATSKGGMFYGNTIKQSQTLNGLWSTLKDNVAIAAQGLGAELLPFLKDLVEELIKATDPMADMLRGAVDFFTVFLTGGPGAVTIAQFLADAFEKVRNALEFAAIMVQTLIVDFQMLAGLWASLFGLGMDVALFLPKTFAAGIGLIIKAVLWGAKTLGRLFPKLGIDQKGIAVAGVNVDRAWDTLGLNHPFGWLNQAYGNSKEDIGGATDKLISMIQNYGKSRKGSAPIDLSDALKEALDKIQNTGKVTNNTINNNITVHGDDPLKMASESLFGKAFQKQFLMIQAATV